MKHARLAFASSRPAAHALAAAVAMTVATASLAGPTDISSTPIVTTSAALVKPNVMLLMDASGSMGRTHMPDEVESVAGVTSIGYKSSQCNALYYNPGTNYKLPRDANNNPFSPVSFNNAPFAGYGAYYTIPDTSTRDLRTQFIAYENATIDIPTGSPDTPGPGYYYVYTGTEPLGYASAPCRQLDTRAATIPTPGGGLWTRYDVSTQTLAQQTNFAIWYSFYRTRLALTKSAASFAFAPINDTRRVGFITVEPKDLPTSAAINPIRYLPLGDFNSLQKGKWFAKVFSQEAKGASPAREGLARVGRYYGGQDDGINNGMPATGADDPIQYACQQNFTIMTTDGYWNGHTESPGGGGVMLDGVTKVGQQDGILPAGPGTCPVTDPYCKRPMWDGGFDTVHIVTDKTNAYTDNTCSIAGIYRSTFQNQQQTSLTTRDWSRTQRRTIQYKQATHQDLAETTQTTKTVTQTAKTTIQYALREEHYDEERYQHVKWQEQTTKVTEQYELQTTQTVAQSFQTTRVTSQVFMDEDQYTTATSQYVVATTQYVRQTDQYIQSRTQKVGRQYLTIAYNWSNEQGTALDGDCIPSPGNRPIECLEQEQPGSPAPIDAALCPVAPATVVVNPVTHVKTTCTDGPMTMVAQPVATCTPGTDPATSGNSWVTTQCARNIVSPAAPFNGTCAGTTQAPGPSYLIFICTQPPASNTSTPVASCVVGPPTTDPTTFITTTCSQPVGPTNQPATASPACGPGMTTDPTTFVTTTCVKLKDFHDYVASCVPNAGTSPPYDKVVCTTNPLTSVVVAAGSCAPGNSGPPNFIETTCPRTAAGPYPVAAPQLACAADPGLTGPNFFEVTCTNPPGVNNQTKFVTAAGCGTFGITNSGPPNFITSDCRKPAGPNNDAGSPADPATCFNDPGTVFPFLKVTCTPTQTMPPTVVDPAIDCTTFGTTTGPAPGYIVTHCDKRAYVPTVPVAACVPINSGPPDFVVTTCGLVSTDTPVASCVLGPLPPNGINTVTCVKPVGPNNSGPNNVASCTPQSPPVGPNFVEVLCSGPNLISSGAVDPALCTDNVGPAPNVYVTTCTTAPIGPYLVATPVAGCVGGTDPTTFVTTTCTAPAGPNNMPPTNSAPCTVGPNTDGNQVTTTCSVSDVTDFVPTASCSNVTQAGTGPEVTCSTVTTLAEAASSCVNGAVQPVSPFDTTIACHNTVTSPMADYAGTCVAGPGASVGETISCNLRPIDVLVLDSGCSAGTSPGGLETRCDNLPSGTGHSYTVVTTKTVTTTPFSGPVPSGPDVVVTTSTPAAPIGPVCSPLPLVFPPKPAVDIAGCTAWPCEDTPSPGTPGSENSLADVAQYYYKHDLRPLMADNVPKKGLGVEDDNAKHQHMTTFALALGVSGTLNFRADYRSPSTVVGDFAAIRAGTKDWPVWPDPLLTYASPGDFNNPKSIDDYWHTAVNGRGKFFNANDATTAAQGLRDALAATDNQLASGSADGTSTLQPSATDNFIYSTKYQSSTWRGDVEARLIDPTSGVVGPKVWSASDLLDQRTFNACDNRKIYVMRGINPLGQFTWQTDLCPGGVPTGTLVTGLNAGEMALVDGANVTLSQYAYMTDGTGIPATAAQLQAAQAPGALVNFLRGQRGKEGFVPDTLTGLFRTRDDAVLGHAVLGDIVDSIPVYVKTPFADYLDAGYSAFKAANAGRTPMIYVGANDGMLHAFYATLDVLDPLRGQEAWAVIPSTVLPNLYKLADDDYNHGGHQFYVDATPSVGDIWTGAAWKTVLVGGLNAGGKGFYALDVTVPGVPPVPMWEFKMNPAVCPGTPAAAVGNTADCNLGLSFGKPVITKLAGTWVVMFTSGYNNLNGASNGADGGGFLYVLNAVTGAILYKIPTEEIAGVNVGTGATPSGLAQINNYVDNVLVDNTTLRVYGGDLLGNIWRFDFLPAPRATLIGKAKDPGGVAQPITVRPELAELNGKPFVMVGTGRLLGASDVVDPQIHSVYGLSDSLTGPGPIFPDPIRSLLRPMKIQQAGIGPTAVRTIVCTGSTSDCGRPDGWVLDLAEAGERVNVEMKLVLGALVFASNVPEEIPCTVGGHSWFNQVDFRFGSPIPNAVSSEYLSDSLNVGFNVLQLQGANGAGPTYTGNFRQSDAKNVKKDPHPPDSPPPSRRISWREIPQ